MMPIFDRRRHPRHSAAFLGSWRFAQIVAQGMEPLDCRLENISWGGACLLLASAVNIPDVFELVVQEYGVRENCRIVWRSGRALGVSFDGAGEDTLFAVDRRTILGSDPVRALLTFNLRTSLKRLPSWKRLSRLIG